MKRIKTTFLDKINNQELSKSEVLNLFENLTQNDLEYSNTGYFEFKISDSSDIILHFAITTPSRISFRYDSNIPNRREGQAFYSFEDNGDLSVVDSGDENYVPKYSFLNNEKTLHVIDNFFENPQEKPSSVEWKNVEEFDWE